VLLVSIFAGGKSKDPRAGRVNRKIELEKEKVANLVPVKEIEELVAKGKGKCAVCRCWKSKKVGASPLLSSPLLSVCACTSQRAHARALLLLQFPYCDGAHMKHNKETGDNVGPFVLTA